MIAEFDVFVDVDLLWSQTGVDADGLKIDYFRLLAQRVTDCLAAFHEGG